MNELTTEEAALETTWRQYYENPLTTATNAMLCINGEDQVPVSLISYENYKGEQTGTVTLSSGGAVEIKLSNGIVEAVPGAAHMESVFLQGGAEVVKREPEDLTRKCISPAERIVLNDKRRPVLLQGAPQSDSPPALISAQSLKDELEPVVDEEDRPRSSHTIIIQTPLDSADKMSTTGYLGSYPAASPQSAYEAAPAYLATSPQPYVTSTSPLIRGSPAVYSSAEPYYREYFQVSEPQYTAIHQEYTAADVKFDRYTRPATSYKTILTVDSSPDSGISSDTVPPREQALSLQQQPAFASYEDISQPQIITSDIRPVGVASCSPGAQRASPTLATTPTSRSWHDFPRHTESPEKIQIPKIHTDDDKIHIEKIDNPYGFKYFLETPISTSPRREDDRITYINKGQFYAITMEYIPDPERQLKPGIAKSIIMLIFREEKSAEDESKAWHFWHGRQHSVKQRILDVDTKNSAGLVNCIEELSHNAVAVYWNPLESGAKVNIAVQCLSTDFSSQKGVKGLPLHLQIDTYEDHRDSGYPVYHRCYCQIKVFCDKGAERKTRDEERRAQKRRVNPTSRKKYEDLYHAPCDRSEFYTMADMCKEPVSFKPSEDGDKLSYMNMEIQGGYYNHDPEDGICGVNLGNSAEGPSPTLLSPQHIPSPAPPVHPHLSSVELSPSPLVVPQNIASSSSSPLPSSTPPSTSIYSHSTTSSSLTTLVPLQPAVSPKTNSLRFHYSLPQNYGEIHKDISGTLTNGNIQPSSVEEMFTHAHKRSRLIPPSNERLMIHVRREGERIYTPLHLVPPGTLGLLHAIEQKFQIPKSNIKSLLRKNKIGLRSRIDDDMIRHYCNEDHFILDIQRREDTFDVTLVQEELPVVTEQ